MASQSDRLSGYGPPAPEDPAPRSFTLLVRGRRPK